MMLQDVSSVPLKVIFTVLCTMFLLVHIHTKGAMARYYTDDDLCGLCELTGNDEICLRCVLPNLQEFEDPSSSLPMTSKRSYGRGGRGRGRVQTFMCGCCLWSRSADPECCKACALIKRNHS